ncbi:MAG TPA: glycosyltransferase [candidate division Zixibacteria bacterium]|nr:glycosyltransferase [candidate division Zixibacteria bacterium]
MTKHRVLHLRAGSFFGGPERQLRQHAQSMADSDFELTVAAFSEAGQRPAFLDELAGAGIKVAHLPTSSSYDISAFGLLRRFVDENNFDIVCTHDYRTRFITRFARLRPGVRWLAVSRGGTSENLKVSFFNAIDRKLIRAADKIVAVSHDLKEQMLRSGIPENKIVVIQNAIDAEFHASQQPVDLRKRFNLSDDSIIAVAAGRFSSEKGQRYLIEEAVTACHTVPHLHLILFGNGPDLQEMKDLSLQLGIAGRITFPGFEKNFTPCLKGADILVNPSRSEGLPNIVMEAMAVGLPVIATAVGDVPKLILPDQTGILIEYGQPEVLSRALIKLAEDKRLRTDLAKAAGKYIRERFSVERQTAEWTALYREMLQ